MALSPVLIVDDDPDIRNVLLTALELADIPVLTAANGVAALALIERERPALVLLDIHMPLLDGPGLVHALAALGIKLPIVVMTSDIWGDRYATDLGAVGFVSKPFLLGQLMSQVRESLAPAA